MGLAEKLDWKGLILLYLHGIEWHKCEQISLKTYLAAVCCNYLACTPLRNLSHISIGTSSVIWLKREARLSQA
jgi:hypothetical protein